MMRIGVVAPRQPQSVGGGFTFQATVLHALDQAQSDHEFMLLDLRGTGQGPWSGNTLRYVNAAAMGPHADASTDKSKLPATALTAKFAAAELGLDVVWYLDPLAEVLPVPVFATVLDLAHRQLPFFPEVSALGWTWEQRESHYASVLPRAARVFVGTQTGKDQVVRCYGVDPTNIVVNPFPTPSQGLSERAGDDEEILRKYGLSPGYLYYPAQFWPHKNHVNLLLALRHLDESRGHSPTLLLTGSDAGNEEFVKRAADELGLRDRVVYAGFVPAEETAVFYRNAAALVYPSLFGPDNLPPLEAFSHGCPVAAGRIEGVQEQLGTGSAVFFDPVDPEEMAQAIAMILSDAELRARLTARGREIADSRTPTGYVQSVLETIDAFEPWRRTWPASGSLQPGSNAETDPAG